VPPETVAAEPEPVICTSEYSLVPLVLLPKPRKTTPLALILIVLPQE
jgi:hypothetical protein